VYVYEIKGFPIARNRRVLSFEIGTVRRPENRLEIGQKRLRVSNFVLQHTARLTRFAHSIPNGTLFGIHFVR
jgi:hypothetical protein